MKKEKFLDTIPPRQRKLYSLNLLMAQLKELKQQHAAEESEQDGALSPCRSVPYNTKLFFTYGLYKPISTTLNESIWKSIEENRNS
ncbi:hypothetical protein QQ020_03180 [Fulvivirgaceae bacterium BMA12]|uniref:Uncharacterized protein n=1 Tax=Agaribacillus aureus TaxID=3051825 RepID=A0ABT8KZW3_9BACT|nr:hypothetical protein [Fulvivirgaceae bacterium BMA12]